jgi:hypothetical protein
MLCRCEGDGFQSNGHIVNISFGGAGIVGTKQIPVEGALLLLTILLPGSTVELSARVAWVSTRAKKLGLADFGVEFLDGLTERQEKLARFIPQHNAVED